MNTTDAFLARWTMETMPACDEGMALLKDFADRSPQHYELAARMHFIDPPFPSVRRDTLWQAFVRHCAACGKCNEL